jgi:prepilin signal peptidase PulO-like enzyme (type II secretory pathway)
VPEHHLTKFFTQSGDLESLACLSVIVGNLPGLLACLVIFGTDLVQYPGETGNFLTQLGILTGQSLEQGVLPFKLTLCFLRLGLCLHGFGHAPTAQQAFEQADALLYPGQAAGIVIALGLQQFGAGLVTEQLLVQHLDFRIQGIFFRLE